MSPPEVATEKSDKWFTESIFSGPLAHIGLEETGDTISAGQCNAEHGIATSCLQPLTTPSPDPWVCVLHKPAEQASEGSFNHVVWEGQHQIVVPDIVCATPEIADDQKLRTISG